MLGFIHPLSYHQVGIMTTIKKNITENKRYNLPEKTTVVRYKGLILVIAHDTANWIVLNNESQLLFYELLKTNPLNTSLKLFRGSYSDAQNVIIQLEAKQFEDRSVVHPIQERMHLYLTNACNICCPHCYMNAGEKYAKELDTTEIKNLLTYFSENGGKSVTLSGGEITMRKDLLDIVKFGFSKGLKMQLLTNGTLWTETMICSFYPYISSIQISIDGYDEESNARIRGKGSFTKALSVLDKFITLHIHTELAITPYYDEKLKATYRKYAQFGKFLLSKYKGSNFSVKFSGELLDGREVHLNKEQKNEYSSIITKIQEECYDSMTEENIFVINRLRKEIKENCTFGCLNVSANGDVYCCSRITMMKPFANIRDTDYKDIMKISNKIKEISKVDHLRPCKDCELKYLCGGDCRIKYFSTLRQSENVGELDESMIAPRICDRKVKEYFYDLMIKTNHRLFR